MEKFLLFCVFSYWIMLITSNDVSRQEVSGPLRPQLGDNITLNCSMIDRYEITWFHLNAEQLTLLVSAEKDRSGRKLLIKYNHNSKRLRINADSWITVVSLVISEITQSDLGLYFCGTKSDTPEMQFDKSFRLETQDKLTELLKDVEITNDDLTVTERALMFGGVGLAFVIFFFATMAAAGIIHQHGWQKGWAEGKDAAALNSDLTTTD
ncbi:uncharacterized protein [Misgurnus anguillicaudatus]|uniref:uncharacterized protein n=1 Tax=Misgurnus anguillicaudatus TaxID=75329 RepID=UPI003CCF100F